MLTRFGRRQSKNVRMRNGFELIFLLGRPPRYMKRRHNLGGLIEIGQISAAWGGAAGTLSSRHVWPRPPFDRRQRDQDRLLDPAASTDPEHCTQLERRAD